jgi:hypothetical protein
MKKISRMPFPNYRRSAITLAIAGNPENDRHLSPWQEAVGMVRWFAEPDAPA